MQRMMQICTAVFREQNPWDRIMKGIARRVSSGGMSIGIVPIFLVMLVFYGIMWKFMKKTGRIILAIFLVICLVVGIAVINELGNQEDMYADGGYVGEIIVAEGYITESEVPVYEGPSADSAQCGSYRWSDYVYIYEIVDGWGRTDWGWIPLDKVSDQLPEGGIQSGDQGYYQDDYQGSGNQQQTNTPTQNTNPTETTAPQTTQPTEPSISSGPIDPSILGSWYEFRRAEEGSDTYYIYTETFLADGSCWDSSEIYVVGSGRTETVGGVSDRYSFDGSTIVYANYYPGLPASEFSYVPATVSGNTLTTSFYTYTRGSLQDAIAAIDQQHTS